MGFISRFKPDRAIPLLTSVTSPGFNLYSFPAMRRLSTLVGSTPLGGVGAPITTLFIPGNWWTDGHEIIYRQYYTWADGGVGPAPGVTLQETCSNNQLGTPFAFAIPTPAAALNTVQGCLSRRMIRQGTQILFWDDDFPSGQFGLTGAVATQPGILIPPPMAGWDFTTELQFIWTVVKAGGGYPATVTVDNAIALIAPPLQLRS